MSDNKRIASGIAAAKSEGRELDDLTAKMIAAQFHDGSQEALAFLSTGTKLGDASLVWRAFFGDCYDRLGKSDKEAADWLGTYLVNRADRGPIPGWENLSW
jgi:hypothetical protein